MFDTLRPPRKNDPTTQNTQQLHQWRRYTAQLTAERQAARRREYERSIRERDGIAPGRAPWRRPPGPFTPVMLTLLALIIVLMAAGV